IAGPTSKDPAILAPRYLWTVHDRYGVSAARSVQHICAVTDPRCIGQAPESRILGLSRPSGGVGGSTTVLPNSTAKWLAWVRFGGPSDDRRRPRYGCALLERGCGYPGGHRFWRELWGRSCTGMG